MRLWKRRARILETELMAIRQVVRFHEARAQRIQRLWLAYNRAAPPVFRRPIGEELDREIRGRLEPAPAWTEGEVHP